MARKQATKRATKKRKQPCELCHGTGVKACKICHGTGKTRCCYCKGEGTLPCELCGGKGGEDAYGKWLVCKLCEGTKRVPCRYCDGTGFEQCFLCKGLGGKPCSKCASEAEQDAALYAADDNWFSNLQERRDRGKAWRKRVKTAEEARLEAWSQAADEKREAEAPKELAIALVWLGAKSIVFIVLLVMGLKDIGRDMGDTVIGIFWVWLAICYLRRFIL